MHFVTDAILCYVVITNDFAIIMLRKGNSF